MMANILVIDDEPGVLQLLQTLLQDEGHTVLGAREADGQLGISSRVGTDTTIS